MAKISKPEQMVKDHAEHMDTVKNTISALVDTVQSELKDKFEGLEKKIEEMKNANEKEDELKATMHTQDLKIKKLES